MYDSCRVSWIEQILLLKISEPHAVSCLERSLRPACVADLEQIKKRGGYRVVPIDAKIPTNLKCIFLSPPIAELGKGTSTAEKYVDNGGDDYGTTEN